MAKLGNARKVYIGTSSSVSRVWLTGEQSNTINRNANLVEVSDKSSNWQKFIAGIKGCTADVTVFADDSDVQQKAVLSALTGGTSVWVFIGEISGSTESAGDVFEALVGSVSDTNDNGSVASRSISLTATGSVSHIPA